VLAAAYAARVATRLSGLCSREWDAVVIGAGPSGGVAAAVLAERGMRVLVVDSRPFPRAKVCGCCLAPAGASALRRAGLGGALRGATELGTLRMAARGASLRLPIERYCTIERTRLDSEIVRGAEERGAEFACGVRARVLDDDGVELSIGEARGVARGRVVVVADGLCGSALRGRGEFAWRIDVGSPVGVGAVLDERPEHAAPGEITMVCGHGGYVGAAPLPGGRWAVGAALSARAVGEWGAAGAIAAVLAECGFGAPAFGRGGLRGVGQLTRRRASCGRGRVLVVGDAAGYVQPLTGEGMSWGIACAARLGEHAARAAAGEDVGRAWASECARALRGRRLLCRGVCAVTRHPMALGAVLRAGAWLPGTGWASRRLCWGPV